MRSHHRWRLLLGAVVLTAGVVTGSAPVEARNSVGVFQSSIAIEALRGEGSAINEVLVEAQQPGELVVRFDDVIPSESLSWERVDLGTTPIPSRVASPPSLR